MDGSDFVFAYGSLLGHARGRPCTLQGWRRGWGAAMDNCRTLPGYRYFLDRETGERPAVFVAFLDIREQPGAQVQGMVFPADLETLDARERNYARVDVTDLTDLAARGRVWAYVGLEAARERCAVARRAGTAVAWDEYVARVRSGFETHGVDFDGSTDLLDLPVRALREVRVP
jgi:cation transport regulator ChaC